MASEPTVACVMLTKDRAQMAARAVAAFRAQTYPNRVLIIYDSAEEQDQGLKSQAIAWNSIDYWHRPAKGATIGELRNRANSVARLVMGARIIAHWDSDDISYPNRLAEQVVLLQSSGADCVGYNAALCWDTRPRWTDGRGNWSPVQTLTCDREVPRNEAWLYANHVPPTYALGASFCYWRRVWEAHPFDAINHGEDERWRTKIRSVGVSSISASAHYVSSNRIGEPRFIIGVHGGNTSPYNMAGLPASYRRVPEWDSYCAAQMALEVRA